tara:strand:+ start:5141 stop:6244 length:1104 start_codon:yes stop_codon:yes gene_type:complete
MNSTWMNNKEICDALDITPRSLRRRINKGLVERQVINGSHSYRILDKSLYPTLTIIDNQITMPIGPSEKAKKTKAHIEQVRHYIEALASISAKTSMRVNIPPPKSHTSLCILLTDTHVGKKTDFGFNTKTALKCINSIPNKIFSLPINFDHVGEIVLLLGGDMIEGEDIYGTQDHHIDSPVIKQVENATQAIWDLAVNLRENLDIPVRIETCPGNHGRMSKTAHEESNWDNVIYQHLYLVSQERCDENLVVNPNFRVFNIINIQGHNCLLHHYGTKHTGTAATRIKLAGWMHVKKWDFMCHGHYHKSEIGSLYGKQIIKNGSLSGYDDLAEQMGEWDPPRQTWFLVTKNTPIKVIGFLDFDHGKTKE